MLTFCRFLEEKLYIYFLRIDPYYSKFHKLRDNKIITFFYIQNGHLAS